MEIKVFANTEERLNKVLTSIMNMACVIAMNGYIPTKEDMENPLYSGAYWTKGTVEDKNKYDLFPSSNNYKAFIRDSGIDSENMYYEVIEFYSRYTKKKAELISELILECFEYNTKKITD